ncbi:hypothetical protein ES703_87967 [subsurface metagenome]
MNTLGRAGSELNRLARRSRNQIVEGGVSGDDCSFTRIVKVYRSCAVGKTGCPYRITPVAAYGDIVVVRIQRTCSNRQVTVYVYAAGKGKGCDCLVNGQVVIIITAVALYVSGSSPVDHGP